MVDFIKAQFGIEVNKLKYKDVVDFFSATKTESINLEFKSNKNDKKVPDKIYNTIIVTIPLFKNKGRYK